VPSATCPRIAPLSKEEVARGTESLSAQFSERKVFREVCVAFYFRLGAVDCVSIPFLCRRCRRIASPTYSRVHDLPLALLEGKGVLAPFQNGWTMGRIGTEQATSAVRACKWRIQKMGVREATKGNMLRPSGLYRFCVTRGGVVLHLEERPPVTAAETHLAYTVHSRKSAESGAERKRKAQTGRGGWCSVYPLSCNGRGVCLSVLAAVALLSRLVPEAGVACRCD
jgi:hypothetical protein